MAKSIKRYQIRPPVRPVAKRVWRRRTGRSGKCHHVYQCNNRLIAVIIYDQSSELEIWLPDYKHKSIACQGSYPREYWRLNHVMRRVETLAEYRFYHTAPMSRLYLLDEFTSHTL